ncbi:MAG: hypothetical protein LH472_14100 [Pyrinomonadaceae bacterium]|nr:hypothetical protein [Pyrinomonadaceae bacterium]
MMKGFNEKMCPQCGSPKIKEWKELTDEQKFLVARLPVSSELSIEQRERHRWCVRCWYELVNRQTDLA